MNAPAYVCSCGHTDDDHDIENPARCLRCHCYRFDPVCPPTPNVPTVGG